jgi:PqqD family protein of HPr-rel-A system
MERPAVRAPRIRPRAVADSSDDRWCAAGNLVWTHYDDADDWAVFHPQSGDVYLVTASAHLLWQLISDGRACTLRELVVALAADSGRRPDEELTAATREALAFMDGAGLVRPISL